jgi:hypothetical protein
MSQEIQKPPSTPKAKAKVATVMGEYKRGKLKSSSGQKVKNRDQAVAIALSEARNMPKRKQAGMGITSYRDSLDRRFGNPEIPMMRDQVMRKYGGTSVQPERPMPRTPSKEEQAAKAKRLAAEKQAQAMQDVEDEKKRKQTQAAYEKATGQKLPKGDR